MADVRQLSLPLQETGARVLGSLEEYVRQLVDQELERRLIGPVWLTLEEAAEKYRTTPGALRKRAHRGQLPGAARDEGRWLVDSRALDEALRSGRLVDDTTRRARAA
jgi:hypothetical protein